MRTIVAVSMLLGAVLVGGCGDDSEPGTTTSSPPTSTTGAVEPVAGVDEEDLAPGIVRVVIGSSIHAELRTTVCTIDPTAQPAAGAPAELVTIDASGEDDAGRPVHLAVRRFRSEAVADTITDTATVATGEADAPDQALVAQRFEVDGVVTDPRDAEADDPLVQVVGDRVEIRGVFAPPGAFAADGGLVEGVVLARCP